MIYRHRITPDGLVQVVICITIGSKPIYYDTITQTKFKVKLSDWDPKSKKLKGNKVLGQVIDNRVNFIKDSLLRLELDGRTINKQIIKTILEGGSTLKTFYDIASRIIEDRYKNIFSKRAMMVPVNNLERYRPGVRFEDIDYKFLTDFKIHLRDNEKNSPNTIWKQFKVMNTVIREAQKQGYTKSNPFDEFDRGKYVNPDRMFLSPPEVAAIENLIGTVPPHLDQVIRYFLLMTYSGLRYSDALIFDPETHIVNGERILIKTTKSKEVLNLKLYPKLRDVVNGLTGKLKLSNQKFNENLKQVGKLAGIKTNLTAHVARHTFGMTLADKGVSLEIAQRLLAHKDIDATKIYYHIRGQRFDDAVDEAFGQ